MQVFAPVFFSFSPTFFYSRIIHIEPYNVTFISMMMARVPPALYGQ